MTRLDRVLIATDLADDVPALIEFGRLFSNTFAAALHLLHVVPLSLHEPSIGGGPPAVVVDFLERRTRDARRRMRELVRKQERERRPVTISAVWGDPVDVILDYARAHDIGLIICGTHGRRGLDRLAMGSVAERLLRHAACPVLTVHGTPHELGQHLTPRCAPAADALADIRQWDDGTTPALT